MAFSYEEKVIIEYLRINYKYDAARIDHPPEYEWNINGMKKLLKKIVEAGDVARKEGFGRPKSVRTAENIELVEEIILSPENQPRAHFTPVEMVRKLNRPIVYCQCPL